MIVFDTSALMAVVLDEPEAEACSKIIEAEDEILLSAGTLAEALIVAMRQGVEAEMVLLIAGLNVQAVAVTRDGAIRAAQAHARWGKGVHPAGLNYGDCFAYALAQERGCKLLFIGNDFSRTEIAACLPASGP